MTAMSTISVTGTRDPAIAPLITIGSSFVYLRRIKHLLPVTSFIFRDIFISRTS